MYLMRRANGDLFTLSFDDREYIAIWPEETSARRFKSANSALAVYWPVLIDKNVVEKRLRKLPNQDNMKFWLLDDYDVSLDLENGRTAEWPEVLQAAGYASDETAKQAAAPHSS